MVQWPLGDVPIPLVHHRLSSSRFDHGHCGPLVHQGALVQSFGGYVTIDVYSGSVLPNRNPWSAKL